MRFLVHVPHPTLSTAMLDKPNMAQTEKLGKTKLKQAETPEKTPQASKEMTRGAEVSGRTAEERAAGALCVPQARPACFPLEAAKRWEHI